MNAAASLNSLRPKLCDTVKTTETNNPCVFARGIGMMMGAFGGTSPCAKTPSKPKIEIGEGKKFKTQLLEFFQKLGSSDIMKHSLTVRDTSMKCVPEFQAEINFKEGSLTDLKLSEDIRIKECPIVGEKCKSKKAAEESVCEKMIHILINYNYLTPSGELIQVENPVNSAPPLQKKNISKLLELFQSRGVTLCAKRDLKVDSVGSSYTPSFTATFDIPERLLVQAGYGNINAFPITGEACNNRKVAVESVCEKVLSILQQHGDAKPAAAIKSKPTGIVSGEEGVYFEKNYVCTADLIKVDETAILNAGATPVQIQLLERVMEKWTMFKKETSLRSWYADHTLSEPVPSSDSSSIKDIEQVEDAQPATEILPVPVEGGGTPREGVPIEGGGTPREGVPIEGGETPREGVLVYMEVMLPRSAIDPAKQPGVDSTVPSMTRRAPCFCIGRGSSQQSANGAAILNLLSSPPQAEAVTVVLAAIKREEESKKCRIRGGVGAGGTVPYHQLNEKQKEELDNNVSKDWGSFGFEEFTDDDDDDSVLDMKGLETSLEKGLLSDDENEQEQEQEQEHEES